MFVGCAGVALVIASMIAEYRVERYRRGYVGHADADGVGGGQLHAGAGVPVVAGGCLPRFAMPESWHASTGFVSRTRIAGGYIYVKEFLVRDTRFTPLNIVGRFT